MTQNDPTDHALAAIASILDSKEPEPSAQVADETSPKTAVETATAEAVIVETDAPATAPETDIEPAEVDGYTRLGPGPLDAIRFRWTARRSEDGEYFVDETIGSHSHPITSGPMPRSAVIGFINARESAARARFDELKRQMTVGAQ